MKGRMADSSKRFCSMSFEPTKRTPEGSETKGAVPLSPPKR